MIKVMIVDDEPYIRQGIKILINWEQYGFKICEEAANGQEAIKKMRETEIDLVITDIKMPGMDGLELVNYTRENISKKINFILLSGFYEFEFAKKAIKYNVVDYVLKPVQRDELIKVLEESREAYYQKMESFRNQEISERIIYDRHLASIVSGSYSDESLDYVEKHLKDIDKARYIRIEYDTTNETYNSLSGEKKLIEQNKLFNAIKAYLGEYRYHAYLPHKDRSDFHIGFIYTKGLANEVDLSEKEYIKKLYDNLCTALPYRVIIYIGQKVEHITMISESFKSAVLAKNFQLYSKIKDISYYDEIKDKVSTNICSVDKDQIDRLIKAIEENDVLGIDRISESLYVHFKDLVLEPEMIKLSMDYLLFSLISLAKELYAEFDQEEVYQMISQGGYGQPAVRGSVCHLKDFAQNFANYMSSLRKHARGGVLADVEKEITENYMDNLSLKSLSEKYFINSAYLGQIFKRQFEVSFKDYLNNYRIDRACEMLLRSDDKVYVIAEAVGFNNTDYFISKFVQIKGTTPLQYRKKLLK